VSYGGAVQKMSAPLDGIFPPTAGASEPVMPDAFPRDADYSSAVALIYGIEVYMLLAPHLDLNTGATVTSLIMYDGQKFWTSSQDVQLTYIASQEVLSQMIAWGTDGTNLFRLFQRPTNAFNKVVRSKYWDNPGYDWQKTGVRLYGIFQDMSLDQPVSIAVENNMDAGGPFTVTLAPGQPGLQLDGTSVWGPYPVGQQGRLIGLTLNTTASIGNLVSLLLREQDFILNE
jgi:hypothetical protein